VWVTSDLETALTPTAVALGNFDGVHRGHQQVVVPVVNLSKTYEPLNVASPVPDQQGWVDDATRLAFQEEFEVTAIRDKNHIYRTVVTFNPHPQEFFTGQQRKLLTPMAEKVEQLRSLGVEQLVLLPFDRELADLSPQQFVETILIEKLQANWISVGCDFRFGKGRTGTSADLQAIASSFGIDVNTVPLQTCQGERISSSAIREALLQGEITQANRLLGRAYTLTGTVVQGQQLGRTIDFPTANLQLPPEKFLPRQGVYCVRAYGSNLTSLDLPIPAVMNIGKRPTVNGSTFTVEVHLLDWSGDLYGQTLTVSLEHFLRPEQKFDSLNALKEQIQADAAVAKALLTINN
jgi:riboflavin kinase/FMN adenylyltransferase